MDNQNLSAKLIFEAVVKGQEDFARMNHNMETVRKSIGRMSKAMRKASMPMIKQALETEQIRRNHDSLSGSLFMSQKNLETFHKGGGKMNTTLGRMGMRLRMATTGLKGFKMELLGIMFFGMGVANFFKGLLKPSADLFGIFELWGIMLSVTFLPVMKDLFAAFMVLFENVMGWDESTKKFAGAFVILAATFGTVLFMIGMIGLGMGSLITAFSQFGIIVTGGTLGLFGVQLLLIAGALTFIYAHQKEVHRGWVNVGIAGAVAFQKIAKAMQWYAKLRAKYFDPFGVWEERAQMAGGIVGGFDEIIDSKYDQWTELTKEIEGENIKQSKAVDDATADMIANNAELSKDHDRLIQEMAKGDDSMVMSKFKSYTEMYNAQIAVNAEMLEATKQHVIDTNRELAKIGKKSRDSRSSSYDSSAAGDPSHALQTSPNAIQALKNYVASRGGSYEVNVTNTISNPFISGELSRAIEDGINKGVDRISSLGSSTAY